MKRRVSLGLTILLVLCFAFPIAPADAATSKGQTFANCKELNKVYKGGVARSASVTNKGGKTKFKPFVSQVIYDANKKSDRDNDLIACER